MMNYRVILLVPEALTFDLLTPEQQAAISSVFGQYVMPMPGTITANGMKVVDAVTASNFHPETMSDYGISWPIIGMWTDTGGEVVLLDEAAFMDHLPTPDVGDKVLHEPHRWAGWPELF